VKRSISLVLVPEIAAAAILAGCGADHRTTQRCVDDRLVVVEEERCEEQVRRGGSATSTGSRYFWYHGGRGTTIGTSTSGGTAVLAHPSVPRGGFGSTAHGISGGS
jgi:hypothetical protein